MPIVVCSEDGTEGAKALGLTMLNLLAILFKHKNISHCISTQDLAVKQYAMNIAVWDVPGELQKLFQECSREVDIAHLPGTHSTHLLLH